MFGNFINLQRTWLAVGVGTGLVQTGIGVAQSIKSNKQAKAAGEPQPFKTSDEAYDILHLSESYAQQGYDALTLRRLESGINRGASNSVNAVERLGGSANQVGEIYDRELESMFKLAGDDKQMQFEHINQYLNSLAMIDANKSAEWQSRENIRKDKLQQAAQNKADGFQNILGGINTASSSFAMKAQRDLYTERTNAISDLLNSSYPSVRAVGKSNDLYDNGPDQNWFDNANVDKRKQDFYNTNA